MRKKDKKAKTKGVTLKTLRFMLKAAWENKPSLFLLYFLEIAVKLTQTFTNIMLPKLLIDELMGGRDIKKLVFFAAFVVGINVISNMLTNVVDCCKAMYSEWFDEYYNRVIAEHSMNMDFEHTENPDALDQLNKAKDGMSWYSGGVIGVLNAFVSILSNGLVMAGVIAIIVMGCPWLLPVQLAALLVITLLTSKINKLEAEGYGDMSKINRVFSYIFWELVNFKFGKDVRLYDSAGMMLEKTDVMNKNMVSVWRDTSNRQLHFNHFSNITNALRDGISYFYIGLLALTKRITVGDFSMYISCASSFYWSLHSVAWGFQDVARRCNYAYELEKFLSYPAAMEKGSGKLSDVPHTIEFSHVSFKYPRTEKYILRDLSLKISSREHLSVVGLNGAGKTTFIKLLCRLYDVTEGEILLDGKNIKTYADDEYRRLFSVVFQDFALFAFSLRENIAFERSGEISDDELYEIMRLTGLDKDAEKLPKGLDTTIYKSFDEDGTELSGGQRQKTAICRALCRNAPVVILDEPTAALDPVAEYEIYRQFNSLVGGKTAIYISHRLSSCKFCDRIAVFAGETVAEYGTHSELVKKENGIYAEMFAAQAQYYAE